MDPKAKEQQNSVSQQPVPTIGVGNKERDLRASLEVSENLPVVPSDLQSAVKPVEPPVPHEPEAGISASMESTPVVVAPSTNIVLPYEKEEAENILKDAKHSIDVSEHLGDASGNYKTDSKFFLAEEVRKFWKKFRDGTKSFVKKPA